MSEVEPTSYAQWVRWWPISLSQAHLGCRDDSQ